MFLLDSSAAALPALGSHLAQFPLGTRLAKLVLFGAVLQCLDPVLTIAACMVCNSFEREQQAHRDTCTYTLSLTHALNA